MKKMKYLLILREKSLERKLHWCPSAWKASKEKETAKEKYSWIYMYIHGKWNICMAPHTPSTEAIDVRRALQMAYREPGTYIHGCHDDGDAKT